MVFVGFPSGQNSEYVTPITLTTPSVRVSLLDNYTSDAPENLRLLLSPAASDMNEFLGHLDSLGEAVKQACLEKGFVTDVSKWKLPLKMENNEVVGILVKAKRSSALGTFLQLNIGESMSLGLRVTCAYFGKDRSGLTLQVSSIQQPKLVKIPVSLYAFI